MSRREQVLEIDEEAVFIEGEEFDSAIVGTVDRCGQPLLVVCDREEVIKVLVAQGAEPEEATEYFDFNIAGPGWVSGRRRG